MYIEPRIARLGIIYSTYRIRPPIVRRSRIPYNIEEGYSDGWAVNYVVGCSHGCIFCYVDSINKRLWRHYGDTVREVWGRYLLIPENLEEAIKSTPWKRWAGKYILMSSMHDPYLPEIRDYTRIILETALPNGVGFYILTRSPLILRDLDLLEEYIDQVRIQVSIPTLNKEFSRAIEPYAPAPKARLEVLKRAKERGFKTGAMISPIFPPLPGNPYGYDPFEELDRLFRILMEIRPDYIHGECLHMRGTNARIIREKTGITPYYSREIDIALEKHFYRLLNKYGFNGRYWPDYRD